MITYSNKLDMTPGGFPCVINLNQYDDDVELQFLLHTRTGLFTLQTGTTAMIRGTKRDGNAYSADATINVSSSTVTVAVTKQMTAAAGKNVFELVLLKGTKVLSTANFILQVEHAAMDADTVTSESVLKEMNALIESASTATAAAEEATEAAQSVSASAAQIEANRQAIAENASGIAENTTAVADLKDDLSQIINGDGNIVSFSDGIVESHGVTFTKDSFNKTVSASGTISDTYSAKCDLMRFTPDETAVYYISGCPEGGGSSGSQYYFFGLWSSHDDTIWETGDGIFYTLIAGVQYSVFVQAEGQGLNMDGLVFYPSIVNVSAHNIVSFDSGDVTSQGVVFAKNGTDKTITTSGTITGDASAKCDFMRFSPDETAEYYISGCPKGGSAATPGYRIGLWDYSTSEEYSDTGDGIRRTFYSGTRYALYVQAKGNGLNMDGHVFRPSIIKVSDYSKDATSLNGLNKEIQGIKSKIASLNQAINILDLGGKNDGSADVGAIINANTANNVIYMPAGKYLVTTPIVLVNSLIGENSIRQYRFTEANKAASVLISGLSTGNIITLGGGNLSVTISDINIYCNGDENAISLGSSYRLCTLKNISISNLGNATGILRSASGSRNLYANNISIFARQFEESTGIEISAGADDRLSNIEIMFCQVGMKLNGTALVVNVHIWTGANSYNDSMRTWFQNTVGLLCSGSFYGTNVFVDTSYYFIFTQGGKIWINNLVTWDDGNASHYESNVHLVKKEGSGYYLRINGGSYRSGRTDISALAEGEAVNFIGI